MWWDLKWVLLGAGGQGYMVWKNIELTYIPQEESLSSGYVWKRGEGMKHDVTVRLRCPDRE